MSTPTQASPDIIKKLEKEMAMEGKTQDARVRDAMKDLSTTEKAQLKAHKAAQKAESAISKMAKKEAAMTSAMHKATHDHDIAASQLHGAQKDADVKRQQDQKLKEAVDAKKAYVERAIKEQRLHNGREAKIAQLKGRPVKAAAAGAGVAGVGVAEQNRAKNGPKNGQGQVGGADPGPGEQRMRGVDNVAGQGQDQGPIGTKVGGDRMRGTGGMAGAEDEIGYPSGGPGGSLGHVGGAAVGPRDGGGTTKQGSVQGGEGDREMPHGDQALFPSGGPGGGCPKIAGGGFRGSESRRMGHRNGEGTALTGRPGGGHGNTDSSGAFEGLGRRTDAEVGGDRMRGTGGGTGYEAGGGHGYGGVMGESMATTGGEVPFPSGGPGGGCPQMGGGGGGGEMGRGSRRRGGSGARELVGDPNTKMNSEGYGDAGDRPGNGQRVYRGTGIGGGKGVGEEPGSDDDRMPMSAPGYFGEQMNEPRGGATDPMGAIHIPGAYDSSSRVGGFDEGG